MSQLILISTVSFLASLLTFFSGFGLGTLLTPVFAIFFPIDLAVAMTALVHFANNLFKLILVGNKANRRVVMHFGLPAILAAFVGAWLLVKFSNFSPLAAYYVWGKERQVLPVKLLIACLMIGFALLEIVPRLKKMNFSVKYLPIGGLLSGFFGGLSGHQGALRSAFLVRIGLSKEQFIATGVVIACLIDVARLGVYSKHFSVAGIAENFWSVLLPTLSAFAGAYFGKKFLKQMTMDAIQYLVSAALFLLAFALGLGLI